MSRKTEHGEIRQLFEVLLAGANGQNYGRSYYSRLERQAMVDALFRDIEPTEELLALAREFAGSHAALDGPTAGTDGPSANEPKTGDVGPKSPENPIGPTQSSRT